MDKATLDELLRYDPETGVFYWMVSRGKAARGSVAGSDNGAGYISIRIFGRAYRAHILAWLTVTGEMPKGQIDHKDTNRANNRFENLRLSTQLQNTYNQSLRKANKSGVKGVHWHKDSNKWRAVIGVSGVKIEVGKFTTIEEAEIAINKARASHHQSFARTQ